MFDKGIDLSQGTQLAQPVTPTIKVAVLLRQWWDPIHGEQNLKRAMLEWNFLIVK